MSILRERLIVGSLAVVGIVGMAVAPTVSAITSNGIVRAALGSSISIDSVTPGTLALSVTPVSGGAQTTDKVDVTVTTNSSLGYQLGLATAPAALTKGLDSIAATTFATWGTPGVLPNNSWGYAIASGTTGLTAGSNFDASYTATSNLTSNASKFLAVPTTNTVVRNVSSGPTSADPTTFWYSVKADTTKPNGNYDSTVTYTATAN